MKFHKQDFKYKNTEKSMTDVNLEVACKVASKLSTDKPFRVMTKDNGRIIVAFLSKVIYNQFSLEVEPKNQYGDSWTQYGDEKTYQIITDSTNVEIVVAEFWTDHKFEYEEHQYIDGLVRFRFDIKEDTGVYQTSI
jgi:hypothetical protein